MAFCTGRVGGSVLEGTDAVGLQPSAARVGNMGFELLRLLAPEGEKCREGVSELELELE